MFMILWNCKANKIEKFTGCKQAFFSQLVIVMQNSKPLNHVEGLLKINWNLREL